MKKLLVLHVLVFVATASAAYGLTVLDSVVHGSLYGFGLQFSYDWANPYWTILRLVQAFMALAAILTMFSSVYVYRKCVNVNPQVVKTRAERKLPSPVREREPSSEPVPEPRRVGGLVRCNHCQRVFAQPLRMLDFHGDRPRIISICPFCNEEIQPTAVRGGTEAEKKTFLRLRKGNHVKEQRETDEAREAVAA